MREHVIWMTMLVGCTLGGDSGEEVDGDPEPSLIAFTAPADSLVRVGSSYAFTNITVGNDGDAPLPRSVDISVGIGHSSKAGVYCYDITSLYVLPGDCLGLPPGESCTIPSLSAKIMDPAATDCLSVPRGAGFYWAIKVDASNVVEYEWNEDDNYRSSGSFTIQ